MSSGSYLRATSLEQALAAVAAGRMVIAGGTDYYPARVGRALDDNLVDITGIAELHGVSQDERGWRIGAATTWTDIVHAELPPMFDGLKLAAREVGGMQIQNAATIAGNLCNASPAADGVPALLALDAEVELRTVGDRRRRLPLDRFLQGNRKTDRKPDEIMTAIFVPRRADRTRGHFLKLGARRYLVISIVMVSASIEIDGRGLVREARIAVGACSEVARRLPKLEEDLRGRSADAALGDLVESGHLGSLAPIDDVRASADYRLDAALTLTRRVLAGLGARA